jgi:hypothetical protein
MSSLGRSLVQLAEAALSALGAQRTRSRLSQRPRRRGGQEAAPHRTAGRNRPSAGVESPGPGSYSPKPGTTADPGEIVWTWVPYEDDPKQGKDRPVLVIGRDRGALLALMLTSRDRTNAESRHEGYVDIGSGPWDRKGRPSEVYLERLLTIRPADVRRIGATLDRHLFDRVMARLEHSTDQ